MPKPNFAAIVIGDQHDPRCGHLKKELGNRTQALCNAGEQFEVIAHDQLDSLAPDTRATAIVL
jgi:hypothetical protein